MESPVLFLAAYKSFFHNRLIIGSGFFGVTYTRDQPLPDGGRPAMRRSRVLRPVEEYSQKLSKTGTMLVPTKPVPVLESNGREVMVPTDN
jgi:hypothetical protein